MTSIQTNKRTIIQNLVKSCLYGLLALTGAILFEDAQASMKVAQIKFSLTCEKDSECHDLMIFVSYLYPIKQKTPYYLNNKGL